MIWEHQWFLLEEAPTLTVATFHPGCNVLQNLLVMSPTVPQTHVTVGKLWQINACYTTFCLQTGLIISSSSSFQVHRRGSSLPPQTFNLVSLGLILSWESIEKGWSTWPSTSCAQRPGFEKWLLCGHPSPTVCSVCQTAWLWPRLIIVHMLLVIHEKCERATSCLMTLFYRWY